MHAYCITLGELDCPTAKPDNGGFCLVTESHI